jgi:Nitrile hydratase, alpha chain
MSPHPNDIKGFQLLDEIAAKASTDVDYRRELLDDPRSVLRDKGLVVDDDVEVLIHRNTPNVIHLVLPEDLCGADMLDVDEVHVTKLICHAF